MSNDRKVPRGALRKGQSTKRLRPSGLSQSAQRRKFPRPILNVTDGRNVTGAETKYQILDKATLETDRYRQDTNIRKGLAIWACVVVSLWLVAVVVFLSLPQFTDKDGLSDVVLVALLSTTTLNVLGISFIVLNGYFKSHRSSGASGD